VGDRLGAEDRQATGDVSTVTVAVTTHTETLPAHVAQAATGIPSLGQSANEVFTPHFYQRLSHPLSNLLKELPVVDGTDVSLLCDFLLKVLKIRQAGQMTELTIYEIMYPYYRGELLALVTNAVTTMENLDFFHARLLGQFILSRQISQLRRSMKGCKLRGESLATDGL
jgi:hypothetical protein